jgi:hypothetical protein
VPRASATIDSPDHSFLKNFLTLALVSSLAYGTTDATDRTDSGLLEYDGAQAGSRIMTSLRGSSKLVRSVSAIAIATSLSLVGASSASAATTPKSGTVCKKVGTKAGTGTKAVVCKKTTKGLRWSLAPKKKVVADTTLPPAKAKATDTTLPPAKKAGDTVAPTTKKISDTTLPPKK